ncbi:flocculation protein FLO11-like [Toxotes jaculatrix]|uniref:flocculation protein FLO11-like n=1 Tax=Toxotes jaculatrix TaxID=941984 RepID=UPI001B3AC3FC|nr:flocculation protein FLO11-like [Toxotes jaculatrix]
MNCGYFLSLLAAFFPLHLRVTASTEVPEINSTNALITTVSEHSTLTPLSRQHSSTPQTWTTTVTPSMETSTLTPSGNTASSSNRNEETVGTSEIPIVAQLEGETSEIVEEINAALTGGSISNNIATASDRNTVSHVTPVTTLHESNQTTLSPNMITNQPTSELSEADPSTSLMDRDKNSSSVGPDASTVVHNVSGLTNSSVETVIHPDSTQSISALTTAESSQTQTMQELISPLPNLTVADTAVPTDILSASVHDTPTSTSIGDSPIDIFVTTMPATPKASHVTDQSTENSIPHLSQTDPMVTRVSVRQIQDKTQTEQPHLTSDKPNNVSETAISLNSSSLINFKATTLSLSATAVTSSKSTGAQSHSAPVDTALNISASTFGGPTEKSSPVIPTVTVTEVITTSEETTSPVIANMKSRSSTYTPQYMPSTGGEHSSSTHQTSTEPTQSIASLATASTAAPLQSLAFTSVTTQSDPAHTPLSATPPSTTSQTHISETGPTASPVETRQTTATTRVYTEMPNRATLYVATVSKATTTQIVPTSSHVTVPAEIIAPTVIESTRESSTPLTTSATSTQGALSVAIGFTATPSESRGTDTTSTQTGAVTTKSTTPAQIAASVITE